MKNLSKLLERFSKALNRDLDLKKVVAEEISTESGLQLKSDDVEIKDGVLLIRTSQVGKSQIALHSEDIKKALNSRKINYLRIVFR